MPSTPLKVLILMCGFCSGIHTEIFQRGSDVTLRCDVPLLSESSTLQWIKDTGQTSNTTLVYNNSAYIILHDVDEHSQGRYYCRLMKDGVKTDINHTFVNVTSYSQNKKLTPYRQSSSHSELYLICKSKKNYQRLMWTWESRAYSEITLVAVEIGGKVQVTGPIKPGRNTSTTYDSQIFILHISPVKFNYSGIYKCIVNDQKTPYTSTVLRTIRVSTEPSAGVLNQSVVLTCEVSDVSDSVMLAWLRMQGNRGVLVKQHILNEKNNKKHLSVNVSSLQSDLLHWQCAVFTENTLRALAPITISLISSTTHAPRTSTEISTSTYQVNSKQKMITVVTVVTLFAGLLLGILMYYWYRKHMSGVTAGVLTSITMHHESEESEPVYVNVSKTRNDRAGQMNIVRRDETQVTLDTVTYASINFNNSKLRT